jgi:capsular polysaccharide biosynthesis protein
MSYSNLFLFHRGKIILGAVVGLAVFLVAGFFFPWEYSATSRLLVIPSSSLGVDPYTAIKSAERISENLSQVVHTSSFFERVVKTQQQFNFDPTVFTGLTEVKRRAAWDREVVTEVVPGTGFFNIKVYNKDKQQALNWASAISYALSTQGFEYTSSNVQIKIVDTPLASRFITRPNFLLFGFLGLVVGALLGAIYILFKYE